MALTLGTNVGFVTVAPTADPAGTGATSDGSSFVVKDTAPTGAIKITEVGWYKSAGTTSSNTQVGLYSADGATVPGEAGTRLQVTGDQASGTSADVWIRFTGLNWPVTAGTVYWLGMQQDAHTGSSNIDTATSGGSGIDTRTSQTALTNPYGGGALGDTDGMYAIYAVYQTAPTVALSSPADSATGVSTTPDLVFTGTDTNGDDVRYNVQVDTASLQDISIDNHTNSGEKTSVSSVTQSHTTGTLTNGAIFVRTMTRGGSTASLTISTVKYNGVDLSLIRSDQYSDADAGQLRTEIWGIKAPSSGANNVVVTFGGTVSFTVVDIITLDGVNQTNITEAVGGGNSINQSSPISNSATTVSKNAWLLDALYTKTADTLTKGANQTQDSQVSTNTAGDMTATSHQGPVASPGSTAMSWTYTNADDYAQSIVVVKPLIPLIDAVSGTDAGFANSDNTVTDNFNRSNENPIGGNWTNDALGEGADNQLKIVSNQLQAVTAGTSCEAYWNAQTFTGAIEQYFTVVTKPGSGQRVEMGFIQNPGNPTGWVGYQFSWNDVSGAGNDTLTIDRVDAGPTGVTLASGTVEYSAGDVIAFSKSSSGVFKAWKNGVVVLTTAADTTYTGAFYAYVGIRDTTGVLDNWGVQDLDPFFSGEAINYTVQSALSNSTTYYWRVRGIDPSGSNTYGAWATTRSFTTTSGIVDTSKFFHFFPLGR